jgi:hypothetical protein
MGNNTERNLKDFICVNPQRRDFSTRFAHFKKRALSGTLLFEKSKSWSLKLLPAHRKTSDRSGVKNLA